MPRYTLEIATSIAEINTGRKGILSLFHATKLKIIAEAACPDGKDAATLPEEVTQTGSEGKGLENENISKETSKPFKICEKDPRTNSRFHPAR